jgi:hypothetical protein
MEVRATYGITGGPRFASGIEVRIDIGETGVKLLIEPREHERSQNCPDVCPETITFHRSFHGPQIEVL